MGKRYGGYAGEPKCADCRHLLVVSDESPPRKRGVCVICERMVGLQDRPHCSLFEPKVPSVPYTPGSPPRIRSRILEAMLVEEIRLALLQVENLLKALEMQPGIGLGLSREQRAS